MLGGDFHMCSQSIHTVWLVLVGMFWLCGIPEMVEGELCTKAPTNPNNCVVKYIVKQWFPILFTETWMIVITCYLRLVEIYMFDILKASNKTMGSSTTSLTVALARHRWRRSLSGLQSTWMAPEKSPLWIQRRPGWGVLFFQPYKRIQKVWLVELSI